MWHRLALAWSCTKSEAKRRCSIREFREWRAFYEIDPWGDQRADLRMGILAAMLANIHRKKGAAQKKPRDFMPYIDVSVGHQTVEQMAAMFRGFAEKHNKSMRVNDK